MLSRCFRLCVLTCFGAWGASGAFAQDVNFQLHRSDDDLTAARAEAEAGEPSLKAIPLGDAGWLSFGGELRARLERASAPSLGVFAPETDNYGLHRALLHADLQANDNVRVFVQVGAYAAPGLKSAGPPAQTELDLQQAFVDFGAPVGDGHLIARLGRQEISLGVSRLVGVRDGPNARLNFDGGRLIYRQSDIRVDAFYLRQVDLKDGVFNNTIADGRELSGVYATLPGGALPGAFDVYLLRYTRPNATFSSVQGDENRWSLGLRNYGKHESWDWDIEATLQDGSVGDESIAAWGLAIDNGVTFAPGDWRIRLGTKLDIVSGDRRPGDGELNSANALYPKLPYLGSIAAFAPSNMVDIHPELTFANGPATVTFGYQAIWRMTTADAVYTTPLIPFANTAGQGSSFTGHQVSIDASWQFSSAWRIEGSVGSVDVTDSLEALGVKDSELAFASLTYRF